MAPKHSHKAQGGRIKWDRLDVMLLGVFVTVRVQERMPARYAVLLGEGQKRAPSHSKGAHFWQQGQVLIIAL